MNTEELREYCLRKPGVTESFPFDVDTLVFKVGGKVFLLESLDGHSFNAKCDPDLAEELRERHPEVKPGYHMNKKHWNTVDLNGSLSRTELAEMVDHSYQLIFSKLTQKQKEEIAAAGGN